MVVCFSFSLHASLYFYVAVNIQPSIIKLNKNSLELDILFCGPSPWICSLFLLLQRTVLLFCLLAVWVHAVLLYHTILQLRKYVAVFFPSITKLVALMHR